MYHVKFYPVNSFIPLTLNPRLFHLIGEFSVLDHNIFSFNQSIKIHSVLLFMLFMCHFLIKMFGLNLNHLHGLGLIIIHIFLLYRPSLIYFIVILLF